MRISEILNPSLITTRLASRDKYGALDELLRLLADAGLVDDRAAASEAIRDREEKMSTGIVPFVALPHGRVKGVHGVAMALGVSHDGVDYGAIDGKPVKVIFLVLSEQGNPGPHLMALTEISRLISDGAFIDALLGASTPEDAMKLIVGRE